MKLIDTSIRHDDGSITERYTDTGNINTAKFKAVPYEFCPQRNMWVNRYFCLYERCFSGAFGNHVFKTDGKGVQYKSLEECEKAIEEATK